MNIDSRGHEGDMLVSERKIKKRQNRYPRSSTLEAAILEVSLWKLIISEIKNDVSEKYRYKESRI